MAAQEIVLSEISRSDQSIEYMSVVEVREIEHCKRLDQKQPTNTNPGGGLKCVEELFGNHAVYLLVSNTNQEIRPPA